MALTRYAASALASEALGGQRDTQNTLSLPSSMPTRRRTSRWRPRFKQWYCQIAKVTKVDGWDNPKAEVLWLVRSWLCDELNGRERVMHGLA
ncbi:uncharacterized protein BDR25DRAFT_362306 [Lindgomyces ingoldianus]|uniref:Uncharacterized protein n=1 Tax=Lindgomyces ingoldianus TaxID=673940 RepID=A0ACB6QAD0_9PLEO|nr:uncharacterized protein BDR25DRAFT_362306 [Lindgomyces ingoldianus]KAF2463878.1 hypothetical protein BDR25DRAFT_362306 [Lindgomyces ingoldianus]